MSTRPTPQRLRALLEYNPATGFLRYRSKLCTTRPKGWFRGSKGMRDYWRIYIDGRNYLVHVIAYVIVKGRWPRFEIKHRNRDHGDNRWSNLRHATHRQVMYNLKRSRNNKTGFRGVSRFGERRYRAGLNKKYKRIDLGLFDSVQRAAEAWHSAARRHYGDHYEP
jgi:hypothetical protein